MDYQIRSAETEDLPRIEEIYAYARAFMAENGNPNQWGKNTPQHSKLVQDIRERKLYVMEAEGQIHGVFFFWIGEDSTYAEIEGGTWRSCTPYGTIHRIAGDGSGGILRTAVTFAERQIGHLRIDTHEDNKVMQKALAKQGFRRRGIIYIEDGTARIAYDRLEEDI